MQARECTQPRLTVVLIWLDVWPINIPVEFASEHPQQKQHVGMDYRQLHNAVCD